MDTTRFVKLFLDGIKQATGSSKAGMQMFEMVYHAMRANPSSDEIKLNFYTARNQGISDRTYHRGVANCWTRVRTNGRNEDRTTGNMMWGQFTHLISRPVNGVPDPHLHAHVFTFNTMWDEAEGRWKAGQFGSLKKNAPYYEAVFQSKLSERVAALGLAVDRTRTAWEIAGLDKPTLDKFSRRTALIEQAAHDQGITSKRGNAELAREPARRNKSTCRWTSCAPSGGRG